MKRGAYIMVCGLACSAGAAAGQTPTPIPGPDALAFDRDGDGRLGEAEARIYALHKINPAVAAYDRNRDGQLDAREIEALQREIAQFENGDWSGLSGAQVSIAASLEDAAEPPGLDLADLKLKKPLAAGRCTDTEAWFVRRDRMDLNAYTQGVSQKEAKGASVALTNDDIADAESAEIHGVVSRVLTRDCRDRPADVPIGETYVMGRTIAVWLQADGLRTGIDPTKDKSFVRLGLDWQIGLFDGPIFTSQYLSLSPYLQSDFRGDAEVFGAQASWEPYNIARRLNGSRQALHSWFDYYWQARLEGDWMHVEDAGHTGLDQDKDYAWLGGSLGVVTFPGALDLDYRLKLYGTWRYHRDVNNGLDAPLYTLGASWNLTEAGDVAVGVERIWGVEREKFVRVERTVLSLNFKL